MTDKQYKSATKAVRSGLATEEQYGSVVPPIYLSSNFLFKEFDVKGPFDYARSGNPSRSLLAEALAELEGGAGAVITASGLGAVTTLLQLLKVGDWLVAPHDCYGGTHRLFEHLSKKGNFNVKFVDQTDEPALEEALKVKPKMVWLETPSNPLLRITDIEKVCAKAKALGALSVVDNTFLSPVLQQPLSLGADVVLHSNTKYINGHSDVVGGSLVCKDTQLAEDLAWWANCIGVTGGAFDSYLTLRGIRTMQARMNLHQQNAKKMVDALVKHEAVEKVYYPGLSDHPGHELAKKQQKGFGGMVSFAIKGGVPEVKKLLTNLQGFLLAESLGGVESLISHTATMTHAGMDPDARLAAGIGDNLLRLSIGIEDGDDLVADLTAALDALL